jgi:hypothetical protein
LKKNQLTLNEAEFTAEYHKFLVNLQNDFKNHKQAELPLMHEFTPGLYVRSILMPAGSWVIGKTHKTEHFNFVRTGLAWLMIDGKVSVVRGGDLFVSPAGCKKVLRIIEDMVWSTTHVTEETDLEKLEEIHVYTDEEELKLFEEHRKQLEAS